MVQTTYNIYHKNAYNGQLKNPVNADILARVVETTDGVGFGIAVSRGTDKEQQIIVGGSEFLGITVRDESQINSSTNVANYPQESVASVMQVGYIYITCPSGCTAGQTVKYNDTTGVIDQGTASTGETQIANATWESTTTAGEVGVIRIHN